MIPARAVAMLLVLATLLHLVLPVISIAQAARPLIKVDIAVTHAAHLPTDGGATVTVQGKFLDFLNFRPAVSIGGHACSRTYWIIDSVRSVKISARIGCESPPGYGSSDLRVDFHDDVTDSQVAWGQALKSVRCSVCFVSQCFENDFCQQVPASNRHGRIPQRHRHSCPREGNRVQCLAYSSQPRIEHFANFVLRFCCPSMAATLAKRTRHRTLPSTSKALPLDRLVP